MRLMKNKKASSVYPALIALAGLLALTASWLILLDKSTSFEGIVGENQLSLIQQYQEGENYLFYMDTAAERSAQEAIAGLASKGGYSVGSECGSVSGYALWNSGGKECYPSSPTLLGSFEEQFNSNMNEYSVLAYLPEKNITFYFLEHLPGEELSFIAKPERYTYFITETISKDSELPYGATSTRQGKDKLIIHYVVLGDTINYEEMMSMAGGQK